MELFETIVVIFALFAWSRTFLRYKSREISGSEFILWTIIWAGLVTIISASTTVFRITRSFGTGRPIDVIVYGSIILLFYLIFRTYTKLENIERSITKITREIAYGKKETGRKK